MSKTGDTKRKILDLLEQKNETLTDISNSLRLAPSTVSQHLKELVDSGSVRLVEDRPRKWKYYEINRGYDSDRSDSQRWSYVKRVGFPIAVIAIALVAAFVFYTSSYVSQRGTLQQVYLAPGAGVPPGSTLFSVSDSPTLYNVSSLVVVIDNLSIHSKTTGKWYNVPLQEESFNLIQLRNISSVLSGVELNNGEYDEIVLHVSHVTATVNGTSESVFLPYGILVVNGNFNITNSTTNWINIDFDLEHSLHIASNGSLVMLPVLGISHVNGSSLQVNDSSIVVAESPGRIKEIEQLGMNQYGNMVRNFSVPENTSIERINGKMVFTAGGPLPVIIRSEHGLFIGGNASGFARIANASAFTYNNFAVAPGVMVLNWCRGMLPGTANANVSENVSAEANGLISGGCCGGLPEPMPEVNNTANATGGTNADLTIVVEPSYFMRCCHPVTAHRTSGIGNTPYTGNAPARRCLPVRGPPSAGNFTPLNMPVNPFGIRANLTASELNNGAYLHTWYNQSNATMLNISVHDNINGSGNALCELENGGLFCNSFGRGNSASVAAKIGRVFGFGRTGDPH